MKINHHMIEQVCEAAGMFRMATEAVVGCRRLRSRNMREVVGELEDMSNRIKGNRPDGSPTTWSDLRLLLQAVMRRCEEVLAESD